MPKKPSSISNPESSSKSRSKSHSSSDRARSARRIDLQRAIQAHVSAGPACGYVADSELDEEGYATCVVCDFKIDIDKTRGVYRANGCTHMFCHDCRETWIRMCAQRSIPLFCPVKSCQEPIASFVSVRSTLRAKRELFRETSVRVRRQRRKERATELLNARAKQFGQDDDCCVPNEEAADRQTSLLSCLPAMSCFSACVSGQAVPAPDVVMRGSLEERHGSVTLDSHREPQFDESLGAYDVAQSTPQG